MSAVAPLDDSTFSETEQYLADNVIGYLRDRGIPKTYAVASCVGVEMTKKRSGAVAFSYWNPDGSLRKFTRWRLFNASRKFDQEEDSGIHVYMPPLPHRNGAPDLADVLDDPRHELIIAEGETRALALNYRRRPSIAIGGITMWGKGGQLCADLQRIRMDGREVLLVFDADVRHNQASQASLLKLARILSARGARCRLWLTPDLGGDGKAGADDFIAERGIRAFDKDVKESARPFPDHPDFAKWGFDGIDIDLTMTPISADWLENKPPEIQWTWEGYLPKGSVALLIAEGGTGKTYLAQRLAQSVASGQAFLDRQTQKGKSIHLAFEDPVDELRRRQYAIFQYECEMMGLARAKPTQLRRFTDDLTQNLIIKSVLGQEIYLATMDGNNVVQGRALDYLLFQLKVIGGVELLIIDPLSRAHSIDNESQAWGTSIINGCEKIAQEVGCSVLVTHHTGKSGNRQKREDIYSSRGASALPDAARVVLRLKHATPPECDGIANVDSEAVANGNILRLINAKLSYGPRQSDTWLYRDRDGVLVHFEPHRNVREDQLFRIQQLYEWWEASGRDPIFRETVRQRYKTIFERDLSRNRAEAVFDNAIERELLVIAATAKNPRGQGYVFADKYRPGQRR